MLRLGEHCLSAGGVLEEWTDQCIIAKTQIEIQGSKGTACAVGPLKERVYVSKEEMREYMLPCPCCLKRRLPNPGMFLRDACMLFHLVIIIIFFMMSCVFIMIFKRHRSFRLHNIRELQNEEISEYTSIINVESTAHRLNPIEVSNTNSLMENYSNSFAKDNFIPQSNEIENSDTESLIEPGLVIIKTGKLCVIIEESVDNNIHIEMPSDIMELENKTFIDNTISV